jgi:hypothetical protein
VTHTNRETTYVENEPRSALDWWRLVGRWVIIALLLGGFIFLASRCAFAQDDNTQIDRATIWLVGAGDMLALGEIVASEACIQQGSCYETNRSLGTSTAPWGTARRAFLKGAGQFVSTYVILKLSKTHGNDPGARRRVWLARSAALGKIVFNGYLMRRSLDAQGEGLHP